jgi:hypothetical protein
MVVHVLKACCFLFGYEESWESAKRYLLGDIRFLERLVEFDVKTKDESIFIRFRKEYLSKEEFNRNAVLKHSMDAATIFDWLIAIEKY